MKRLIFIELRKGIGNRWFFLSLFFGIVFVLISLFVTLKTYYSNFGTMGILKMLEAENLFAQEDITHTSSLYKSWVGGDHFSLGHTLFYTLVPLLTVLPCGWCFSEELNCGYLHMVIPLCGRHRYFAAKMIASFIIGGLLILIPQIISLLLASMFFIAPRPNVVYYIYYTVMHGSMLSELFYTHPLLYLTVILGMDTVFGGLYALLSLTVAMLTKKKMSSVSLPFILLLLGDMAKNLLLYVSYIEISPINILHPLTPVNYIKAPVVLGWMVLLASISVPVLWIKGGRHEIS